MRNLEARVERLERPEGGDLCPRCRKPHVPKDWSYDLWDHVFKASGHPDCEHLPTEPRRPITEADRRFLHVVLVRTAAAVHLPGREFWGYVDEHKRPRDPEDCPYCRCSCCSEAWRPIDEELERISAHGEEEAIP